MPSVAFATTPALLSANARDRREVTGAPAYGKCSSRTPGRAARNFLPPGKLIAGRAPSSQRYTISKAAESAYRFFSTNSTRTKDCKVAWFGTATCSSKSAAAPGNGPPKMLPVALLMNEI
jgi:hypothetical protein